MSEGLQYLEEVVKADKLQYLKDQFLPHDCPNCKKSTRNHFSFITIILSALMTGFTTSVIFWVVGGFVGLPVDDMETRGMKLTSLFGTTVFLWWTLWQYDKIICTCDEQAPIENWMGVE